jgi:hypothetical protein
LAPVGWAFALSQGHRQQPYDKIDNSRFSDRRRCALFSSITIDGHGPGSHVDDDNFLRKYGHVFDQHD